MVIWLWAAKARPDESRRCARSPATIRANSGLHGDLPEPVTHKIAVNLRETRNHHRCNALQVLCLGALDNSPHQTLKARHGGIRHRAQVKWPKQTWRHHPESLNSIFCLARRFSTLGCVLESGRGKPAWWCARAPGQLTRGQHSASGDNTIHLAGAKPGEERGDRSSRRRKNSPEGADVTR